MTSTAFHRNLLIVQKDIKDEDEQAALSLNQEYRRFFVYVQMINTTHNEIKITLFNEGMVRIFHQLAMKDIVYFDATGSLVAKVPNFKKIFNYCIAVRHPFSKAPPLPVLECISSSHNSDSVRSMIVNFREKENILFGKKQIPKLLVCDFSRVLISASLFEFNGESIDDYLERTFLIKTGDGNQDRLNNKMFIHVCSGHLMKQIKYNLHKMCKENKSHIHFEYVMKECNGNECNGN